MHEHKCPGAQRPIVVGPDWDIDETVLDQLGLLVQCHDPGEQAQFTPGHISKLRIDCIKNELAVRWVMTSGQMQCQLQFGDDAWFCPIGPNSKEASQASRRNRERTPVAGECCIVARLTHASYRLSAAR